MSNCIEQRPGQLPCESARNIISHEQHPWCSEMEPLFSIYGWKRIARMVWQKSYEALGYYKVAVVDVEGGVVDFYDRSL